FKADKERPVGAVITGGKLLKKSKKSLEQLKRHDPDVEVANEPTKVLFVSNSSILCSVSPEELQEIFTPFDAGVELIVFPNRRAYSFIEFCTVEAASKAKEELNGKVPEQLKKSHLPFVIEFVKNLPLSKTADAVAGPRDLIIIDDFVDEDIERDLIDLVMKDPRLNEMKHRSVLHFGHAFDYSTNSAFVPIEAIPDRLEKMVDRLIEKGHIAERPDQITANVYSPGQGIPSHFDTHSAFEDPVVSLSLLADVVMEFKDAANSARVAPILLPRRSLCLIQGDSRYRWKHGIVNRQYDVCPRTNRLLQRQQRVSITFRKIRREPCRCEYKEFCDWDRNGEMAVPSLSSAARALEGNYVADVYEKIAPHFDETRHAVWSGVKRFLDSIPKGSLLYDIGCGNGKYLLPERNDGLIKIGADRCLGLCEIAASKGCCVVRGDALGAPLRSGADAVISIAVLHHMSTKERRKKAVGEIASLLRVGGRACVTVWSLEQGQSEYSKMRENRTENGEKKNEEERKEEKENGRLLVHDGREFVQQDLLVPWTISGKEARKKREEEGKKEEEEETFLRFYHVFAEGELAELVQSVDGLRLESIELEQGNYVAVFERIR
ncbi:hypothetical protein PENTCL1PPCAC_12898, partial [Pristionchus entomophagus]